MNKKQKASIIKMRSGGMAFSEIADHLHLSINTVKSFYRRNAKTISSEICKQCGKPIVQTKHKRQKKFCSDKCRN
ncbi:MAG: RNA polymerase subunit sigma-70, partial [Clostridia bacterium]|nr:RNA polymerase subunit sigma-70 [Clostridia bacterium]